MLAFLRRQTKLRRSNPVSRFSKVKNRISALGGKNILWGSIAFLCITALTFGLIKLVSAPQFAISQFEIFGNESVSAEEVRSVLSDFDHKSIFTVRSSAVEQKLYDSFIFFKRVKVRKILPNRLQISLSEREPGLILVNVNGVYLVDEDAHILEIIYHKEINFDEEQLRIVRGLGDPNASYVKDRMLAELQDELQGSSPEELTEIIENFDFNKIELSKKFEVLEKIRSDLRPKVEEYLERNATAFDQTKYADIPIVFAYENNTYAQYAKLNDEILILSLEASDFLTQNGEQIVKISWEGTFLISIRLANGKEIVFGANRSTSEQIEDYVLVTKELNSRGDSYSRIDLSSKKISVR